MGIQQSIFILVTGIFLGSCVLRDAKPAQKQEVYLFTDELTQADSTVIKDFERKTKCNVRIQFMKPEEYLKKAAANKYNSGADVLWFSNDSIREKLYEHALLSKINSNDWKELESEFSVQNQLWFPICHDPLLVTKPIDSTKDCRSINFNNWHRKDSLSPNFINLKLKQEYFFSIKNNVLAPIILMGKNRKPSNEMIWKLSALAKKYTEVDSNFHEARYYCKNLISYHKKHITSISCLYKAKYCRNGQNANLLIDWLVKRHKFISSSRYQLSCRKNTEANYIIRNMSLNY